VNGIGTPVDGPPPPAPPPVVDPEQLEIGPPPAGLLDGVGDAPSGGTVGVAGGELSDTGRVGRAGGVGAGGVGESRFGGVTVGKLGVGKLGVGNTTGSDGEGRGPKRSAAKPEVVVRTIAEKPALAAARMHSTTAALAFPRPMPAATGGLKSPTALTFALTQESRQPHLACLRPDG